RTAAATLIVTADAPVIGTAEDTELGAAVRIPLNVAVVLLDGNEPQTLHILLGQRVQDVTLIGDAVLPLGAQGVDDLDSGDNDVFSISLFKAVNSVGVGQSILLSGLQGSVHVF